MNNKRFLLTAIVVSLLLLLTLSFYSGASEDVTVTVESQNVGVGETVRLKVYLSEAVSVKSGGILVNYDSSVLELRSARWNVPYTVMSVFDRATNTGVFACNNAVEVSNEVFEIEFVVRDSAAFGETDVSVELQLKDERGNLIPLVHNSGALNIVCAEGTHDFTLEDNEYLATPATSTEAATYYYSCSRCGAKSEDTYVFGTRLHSVIFDDKTCAQGELVTFELLLPEEILLKAGGTVITYDNTVLEYQRASFSVTGMVMSAFKSDKNVGAFACSTETEVSGKIFSITFRVIDTAALGETVVGCETKLLDGNNDQITVEYAESRLTVLCNHDFTVADNSYPATPATYTEAATYYYSCSRCGEVGTDTYSFGTPLVPLSLESVSAPQGGEMTVYIALGKETSVVSGGIAVDYDSSLLQLLSGRFCTDPAPVLSTFDLASDRGVFAFSEETVIEGEILAITFKVADDATLGETEITFEATLKNDAGVDYTVEHNFGSITITCGHRFTVADNSHFASAATCHSPELYYYSCEKCGEAGTDTYAVGSPLEHSFDGGVVTLQPTHLAEGEMTYTCILCGDTVTEAIPKLVQMLGDIDGNGVLNSDDSVYLLMHIFYPDVYFILQSGDFDHNGTLNSDDSIYLLMHIFYPDVYPLTAI